MAKHRVIALAGGSPTVAEAGDAGEALTPGHLIMISGASVVRHNVLGGIAARNFVLERDELGRDIDTAYAVGDRVKLGGFRQGQVVHALVPSGAAIVAGTYLASDGAGRLIPWASGYYAVAMAADEPDYDVSPGLVRVKAEII